MILSIITSFLIARGFQRKTCVIFTVVTVCLISFFSVGLPYFEFNQLPFSSLPSGFSSGILIRYSLPLSFPLYSVINETTPPDWPIEFYQIKFFTVELPQSLGRSAVYQKTTSQIGGNAPQEALVFNVESGDYILYLTFFLFFNLIGAILGHWAERYDFIPKTFKIARNANTRLDDVSVGKYVAIYIGLATTDIAQTALGFPKYEAGLIANLFIRSLGTWAWLYFVFYIALTSSITLTVSRFLSPSLSKRIFFILSVLLLVVVISNTYSLAMTSRSS